MVRYLHAAGIEVILDVVYNHTAEANEDGPTLSFRGIDNASYYRLESNRTRYVDFTGCGNSLNVAHPRTLQLVMDSLRYWVTEMHVDGFRFDLASALARDLWEVDKLSSFFDIIQQDPVLSEVKLIAEPWDIGPSGYQVGNFPVLWSEWNGKYRDCVRRFWKGHGGTVGELASRLSGSSDLYADDGRRPSASVNFITAHDGFTLRDLVSYNQSIMKPTAKKTATERTITKAGTAVSKARPKTPALMRCAHSSNEIFSSRSFSLRGCRCFSPEMNSARPSTATTTSIARIRQWGGSIGIFPTNSARSSISPEKCCTCARHSQFSGGVIFFRAGRSTVQKSKISTGSNLTGPRCLKLIGMRDMPAALGWRFPAIKSPRRTSEANASRAIPSPSCSTPATNPFPFDWEHAAAICAGNVFSTLLHQIRKLAFLST